MSMWNRLEGSHREGWEGVLEAKWYRNRLSSRDAPSAWRWVYSLHKMCKAYQQCSEPCTKLTIAAQAAFRVSLSSGTGYLSWLHLLLVTTILTVLGHQKMVSAVQKPPLREKQLNFFLDFFNNWPISWAGLLCTKDPCMKRPLAHRWSPFCTRGNYLCFSGLYFIAMISVALGSPPL